MKKLIQIMLVFAILLSALTFINNKVLADFQVCGYQLSFSDDFNGTSLDSQKWNTQYPSGNSGEQQFYAPDAFTVDDGILTITADKRAMQGYPYTSGIITTQGTFSQQYGIFSIRAKLPKGQGFWPAFWMLPEKPAYPTEVDVFEMLGKDPNTIYMSNHWRDANKVHQVNMVPYLGPDFSKDFHTFSVEWTQNELVWSVDGVEQYRTSDGVPNMPMFLLANLAVGGNWPGNPDKTTTFPSTMQIDYIRVYQHQCYTGLMAVANRLEFFIRDNPIG